MSEAMDELNRKRAEEAARRRARLLAELQAGKTQAEVAREWGVSRQRVGAMVADCVRRGELVFAEPA